MKGRPKPSRRQPITTVRRWQIPRGGSPNARYRYGPPQGHYTTYRVSLPPGR